MPWSPKQARFLLSKGTPLTPEQKQKMLSELHGNPSLIRKGSMSKLAEAKK